MPKGNFVRHMKDQNIKFDFAKPSDRWMADLWKGWFRQAAKACQEIPWTHELIGTAQQFITLREPEVSTMFITYRLVNRDNADDIAVLVLARR